MLIIPRRVKLETLRNLQIRSILKARILRPLGKQNGKICYVSQATRGQPPKSWQILSLQRIGM